MIICFLILGEGSVTLHVRLNLRFWIFSLASELLCVEYIVLNLADSFVNMICN